MWKLEPGSREEQEPGSGRAQQPGPCFGPAHRPRGRGPPAHAPGPCPWRPPAPTGSAGSEVSRQPALLQTKLATDSSEGEHVRRMTDTGSRPPQPEPRLAAKLRSSGGGSRRGGRWGRRDPPGSRECHCGTEGAVSTPGPRAPIPSPPPGLALPSRPRGDAGHRRTARASVPDAWPGLST